MNFIIIIVLIIRIREKTWLAEIHAWVTVWPGILNGKPAPKAASRAILLVLVSWITVP